MMESKRDRENKVNNEIKMWEIRKEEERIYKREKQEKQEKFIIKLYLMVAVKL